MTNFYFATTLQVRYGDLDAQGHVNNAMYFTYLEQARLEYWMHLGMWKPADDFLALGQIVAEATCSYKRPILLGQTVTIKVRVSRLGNKSLDMEYILEADGELAATGRTVQVMYDYRTGKTMPIPAEGRKVVMAFEHLE